MGLRIKLEFLSTKKIPTLFWSSSKALTATPKLISVVFLIVGLILFGLGEAETNFTPSPSKILAIAILLGFCFLAIVTTLIIITGQFL